MNSLQAKAAKWRAAEEDDGPLSDYWAVMSGLLERLPGTGPWTWTRVVDTCLELAALEISDGRADLAPEDRWQLCALMAAAGVIRGIMDPADLGALEVLTGKLESLQVEIRTGLPQLHWKRRPWWSRR